MSRWSYGNWAMAAVVIEESGDVYPLSELYSRRGMKVNGYYEEKYWLSSEYYRMDDLTGSMGSREEGFFEILAHVQITDGSGKTKEFHETCEGYTCCDEDCYMLLIVSPGDDAASTTVEFQDVDCVEFKEAVGAARFEKWWGEHDGESALVLLDKPLF